MSARRETQQAHEKAQVALFIDWYNRRYRTSFVVIAEPNPPEAIIRHGKTVRWVEVSTAFWSDEYARDEYSYATPGERHISIDKGPFLNSDAQFSERFISVVKKKLEKSSYLPSKAKYGPGYLVVPILYPLFNDKTLALMKVLWQDCKIQDLGCFRGVFITYRSYSGSKVSRWYTANLG